MPTDPNEISNFLVTQRDEAPPDLQPYFLTFEDYWERKLWHELTDLIVEYFRIPESGPQRLPLFNEFVKSFSEKINQLKLVNLGLLAFTQFSDDPSRLAFLESLAETVNKPSSQDAYVSVKSAAAGIKLRMGDQEGSRKDLDEAESILDSFDAVDTTVHARFYSVNGDYYNAKREFASYYKNALLYLACVDIDDMALDERQKRAYDLSIAALISDSIYNFGELLLHPILNTLKDTPHSWLRDLLFAFNAGELGTYESLTPHVAKNELLSDNQMFLHQKISLSALTEAVFRRAPGDRAMTFRTIQDETKVKLDDIEHLIMKALSLGLVRGTIDQVAQIANINWVQPKILDMKQIEGMRSRLGEWDTSVNQLGNWIEGAGKDVWAA